MAEFLRDLGLVCVAMVVALLLSGCAAIIGPTIQVGSVALSPGGSGEVLIQAFHIPGGLQGIEVSAQSGDFLSFDPDVIRVSEVEAVAPFSLDAVKIDNASGRISFIARTAPTGPFLSNAIILQLQVQHVGEQTTPVQLEVTNIVNGDNQAIVEVAIIPGIINIVN